MKGLAKIRYIGFLFMPYWRHGKLYMIITIAMSALFQPAMSVLSTLLPQYAIDAVMRNDPAAQIIRIVALFTAGIALVTVTQNIINSVYTNFASTKIYYKIFHEVQDKALHTDFKYYDNPEFFNVFSYAQQNFANQANQVANMIPTLIQAVVTSVAMSAIIAQAGPTLFIVTLAVVVLQTALSLPQSKLSADFSVKVNDIARPVNYVYRVILQKENAAEMRSSTAGKKLLNNFVRVIDNYIGEYKKYIVKLFKFSIPQGFLSPIQNAVVLLYIIIFVIEGDTSKIGLYASLTAATGMLAGQINMFFSQINQVFQQTMYGERIARFFEAESDIEVPAPPDALDPPDGQYSVEFKDVAFGYENAAFGIEGLNLKIPAGGRIAIVGENGAGKSTLTKLLLRLYDVGGGEILINGRDIRDYDVHRLRRRIGIAYQDVRILAMSLRDNLTAYHDATDDELRGIMHKLGLDGVLDKIGGDFDKMVSREFTEDGAVLSGGESQRVAIARLFTGPFGLLLLDEPSSALDPLAEYNLMKLILDKSNTATTIMIAHRLSTVRDFDIIYHMDDGKIIESGTHDELMAAKGKYYEMFSRQAENYQDEAAVAAV